MKEHVSAKPFNLKVNWTARACIISFV